MRLLGIYSTVRSATTYMARTLEHCDVHIGHGKQGLDGGVFWWPRPFVNPPRFQHTWHQTRDPLKVIASIADPDGARLFWRLRNEQNPAIRLDEPLLLRSMVYWHWASRAAERLTDWQYRIEDVSDGSATWLEICRRLGLGDAIFPNLPTDTNTKPHPELVWPELLAQDESLAIEIAIMAEAYGYETTR